MNKQSVWKRALSLMLAVSMSVGNIPTAAFAENVNAEYEEETELTTEAAAEAPEESEAPSERATEAIPAPETVSATEAEPATEAVPEQQEGGDESEAPAPEETPTEFETDVQQETETVAEPETQETTEPATEQVTDVPEETQTEEVTETETEKEYPELTKYVQMDDGSVVGILAPEGAFPEGTVPVVKAVDLTEENPDQAYVSELLSILTQEAQEELTPEKVAAYDIYFYEEEDADQEHIQPKKPVEITFDNINVEGDEIQVYHVPEKKYVAEKVSAKSANPEEGYASIKVKEAKDFSVYAVVGTTKEEEDNTEQKIITIHYGATEGGSVSVEEEKVLVTFSEEGEVIKVESAEGVEIDNDGNIIRTGEGEDPEEAQNGSEDAEGHEETDFVLQGSTAIAEEADAADETESVDDTVISEEESEEDAEEGEYTFQYWVNSQGEVVSDEETFVPEEADLIEDEEFTAVFTYGTWGVPWGDAEPDATAVSKGYIYRISDAAVTSGNYVNGQYLQKWNTSTKAWEDQSDWIYCLDEGSLWPAGTGSYHLYKKERVPSSGNVNGFTQTQYLKICAAFAWVEANHKNDTAYKRALQNVVWGIRTGRTPFGDGTSASGNNSLATEIYNAVNGRQLSAGNTTLYYYRLYSGRAQNLISYQTFAKDVTATLNGKKIITGRQFKSGDAFTFTVTSTNGGKLPNPATATVKPTSGKAARA